MWTPFETNCTLCNISPANANGNYAFQSANCSHTFTKQNVSYYAVLSKYWVCDILKYQFFQFHRSWVWDTILK